MDYEASIVLPLLNQRRDWLEQSILSAVNQTIDTEVVVVFSDKTKTETISFLQKMQQRYKNLIIAKETLPLYGSAFNTGFRISSAIRVGILFSDDWLEPNAIEECLRFDTDIVSSGMSVYDDSGKKIFTSIPNSKKFEKKSLCDKASYLKHFFLFRYLKLKEIGGVDENIGSVGPDDFDMIWILLENNATVSLVGKALYNYRDHSNDRLTLRKKEDMIDDLKKILKKHKVSEVEQQKMIKSKSKFFGKLIKIARRS